MEASEEEEEAANNGASSVHRIILCERGKYITTAARSAEYDFPAPPPDVLLPHRTTAHLALMMLRAPKKTIMMNPRAFRSSEQTRKGMENATAI